MLVLWRLFGLLVRERSVLKLVGANLKDGQNVLVGVGRRHRRGRRRWRWRSRAADGVGRGVCFCRPLGCLRGRAADGGRPHQEDSI